MNFLLHEQLYRSDAVMAKLIVSMRAWPPTMGK